MITTRCLYRRNLKMPPAKLAAQLYHLAKNLNEPTVERVIVLQASDVKFNEKVAELAWSDKKFHVQIDSGMTIVPEGTPTVVGWLE